MLARPLSVQRGATTPQWAARSQLRRWHDERANSARNLAKLDATTGAIDTTFSPPGATTNGFDDEVQALAIAGTSIIVGGRFTSYRGTAGAGGMTKLDATNGAADPTFVAPDNDAKGIVQDDSNVGTVFALHVAGSTLWVGAHPTRSMLRSRHG